MAQSLAVKYRPISFDDVLGQESVIRVLKRQLAVRSISNCYLFCGPSGDGKTTIARILAKNINNTDSGLIEIDGASNNGVDAVRSIIESARERSIDSEYKIFLIDECHMITTAGWNAFLKCIEEPPEYTIFMFCTTNPEKIPETILNRVMRFNLTKIDTDLICNRLLYICEKEGYANYRESCDFIAKLSCGGVRDAIAMLEKCANYDNDLSINNVLACTGNFSYESFFNLTSDILNGFEEGVIETIENYYKSGNDLKIFIEQYLDFMLDLTKYCLYKDMHMVKIPSTMKNRCEGYSSIPDIRKYSVKIVEKILEIKLTIKYDVNSKTTIETMFLSICRSLFD